LQTSSGTTVRRQGDPLKMTDDRKVRRVVIDEAVDSRPGGQGRREITQISFRGGNRNTSKRR
jgi:hypothetical protein